MNSASLRYRLLVVTPLLAAAAAAFIALTPGTAALDTRHRLVLCAASALANLFVLYYHYTTPPHPKFLMLTRRRISIRLHVIAGSVELAAGTTAFFLTNPATAATIMAAAALLIHIPTAIYQAPIVFGARAIMAPSYQFVILLHAVCAVNLLLNPTSQHWLISTYLAVNLYVWCRVFIGMFNATRTFPGDRYTVGILTSGLLLIPAIIGTAGNLLLIAYIAAHYLLYRLIVRPDQQQLATFLDEHRRESLIDSRVHRQWLTELGIDPSTRPRDAADQMFNHLTNDGTIPTTDMVDILNKWHTTPRFTELFTRHHTGDTIDADTFYTRIWRSHHPRDAAPAAAPTAQEKARAVFDFLDLDASGTIDPWELRLLLTDWGLPQHETDRYLATYDNGDRIIDFAEFEQRMKPIWRFGYPILTADAVTRA